MKKYRCYYLNDFNDDYAASSEEDADGDWYRAEDVDARIAELNTAITELGEMGNAVAKRRDELAGRVEELEKAITAVLAHQPEWCQECAVGSTPEWQHLKSLMGG
jgi:chromosome segregation ATPase